MNKIALFLTAALVAGFVSIRITGFCLSERPEGLDEQKLNARIANYRCFKQTLVDSLEALESGHLSLREAQERIRATASRFHPIFLETLALSEPGPTEVERVAHNLVEHVRADQDMAPHLPARVRALEIELEALVCEQQRAAP